MIGYGGLGYGYGLGGYYGGYGYGGLGYGYGGYGYGGSGYGYGGSGYGYSGSYPSYSPLGVPAIPGASYPGTTFPQYQSIPANPNADPNVDPMPIPLPNSQSGSSAGGAVAGPAAPPSSDTTTTAKITVITNEGAKVSFEGIDSDQTGSRHSFTTKPLGTGETRVKIQVDGATMSMSVRAGEKATIDMRK